jgi:hypothetical protein
VAALRLTLLLGALLAFDGQLLRPAGTAGDGPHARLLARRAAFGVHLRKRLRAPHRQLLGPPHPREPLRLVSSRSRCVKHHPSQYK